MQYEDGNLSPLKVFFKNKWVRAILIIDFLIILVIIGIAIWNANKTSTIIFNIAPVDATISVNGNTNYTNGQYAIMPGTYNIQISHEGLESKTFTIDIAPHYVVNITTFLVGPDNNFEFYELRDNYESLNQLIDIASPSDNKTTDQDNSAKLFIEEYQKITSIIDILPIIYEDYSPGFVDYFRYEIKQASSTECDKILCLEIIDYTGGNEQKALGLLHELGYNPDNYGIAYEYQPINSIKVNDE